MQTMLGAMGLAGGGPALGQLAPHRRKLVGLAIGINDYAHIGQLHRAAQDAIAVSQRMAGIGYEMETLATDFRIDRTIAGFAPDTDEILDAFARLMRRIDNDTAAFVFLAGHGVQVRGQNYFLPANVGALDNAEALGPALTVNSLLQMVDSAKPVQSIFVLDACRNEAVGKSLDGFGRGFSATQAPQDCSIAYSASNGQYALDRLTMDDPSPNGLFTRHMLEHLQPEKTIYEVFDATRAQVAAEAEAVGHSQNPAIYEQARRPLWIDGEVRRQAGTGGANDGSLEGTGFVIAASDFNNCGGRPLKSPKPDAARLEAILRNMGATVAVLSNPSKSELLGACSAMGRRDLNELAFLFTGTGQRHEEQACIAVDRGLCAAILAGKETSPATELVSHSDLVNAFRQGISDGPGTEGGPRPLSLFLDIGMAEAGPALGPSPVATNVPFGDLHLDYKLQPHFKQVALLLATGYDEIKKEGFETLDSSPFVAALINALKRPGIPLQDFARVIEDEVRNLTDNAQSPRLFASRDAERRVLVRARARPGAKG